MENVASRFGQRLAHTEKKYRDQALKKLSLYLTKRSQWSDLEWDKLWKALFYCMWMSDKRPIQDELSSNLAALVHKIPSVDDALGFVHSFFRTMHREWHGIDGLRLDKFYALIRKFVHQSLLLLANHEWDTELVQRFVSIISGEVMSQLPNGLRLHLTDLYVEEMYKAIGETVDGDAFLLLLEPFFTLLSSEYDKTVFKRVRELVFGPMLATYVFGPVPEKKKKASKKTLAETGETDEEEQEEEDEEEKRFPLVELARVQHRIFAIASADDTAERNRSALYDLYGQFFKLTKVDSLKAAATLAEPVKKVSSKRKQREEEEEKVEEKKAEEDGGAEGEKKKRKRRKKNKKEEKDATMEEAPPAEEKEEVKVATPEKKQKKNKKEEEPTTPATTPVKSETPAKKDKKKKEDKKEEDVVMAEDKKSKKKAEPVVTKEEKQKKAIKTEPVAETPVAKKEKKIKAEPVAAEKEPAVKKEKKTKVKAEPVEEPAPTPSKKDKKVKAEPVEVKKKEKTEDANIVVRSGMKLRRCAGCGGIGKGLVPAGKQTCRHCERTGALKKKELKEAKKAKRKADEMASSTSTEAAETASKKVTFGKNRALAHELSVKRLKASAKEPATKELTETHKGVLRVKSSPATESSSSSKAKSKSRMKAADFF